MELRGYERDAAERLCRHLESLTTVRWNISREEVRLEGGGSLVPCAASLTNRSYDCELVSPDSDQRPIAVEITRIFTGYLHPRHFSRELDGQRLLKARLAGSGIAGWHGRVWVSPDESLHKWVRRVHANILEQIANEPSRVSIETKDVQLERLSRLCSNSLVGSGHGVMIGGQPHSHFRESLFKAISEKSRKFDRSAVQGDHATHLLLLAGCAVIDADSVSEACSLIDFGISPIFERIYFHDVHRNVTLVYDRSASLALAQYTVPQPDGIRAFAFRMLWYRLKAVSLKVLRRPDRMSRDDRALLDFVWEMVLNHGPSWIPDGGWELLEVLSESALETSGWEAPREYSEQLAKVRNGVIQ